MTDHSIVGLSYTKLLYAVWQIVFAAGSVAFEIDKRTAMGAFVQIQADRLSNGDNIIQQEQTIEALHAAPR